MVQMENRNTNMTQSEYIKLKVYDNYTYIDVEEETKEMLNNNYDFTSVGGPFRYMMAGDVLEDCDLTAFRQEVLNYRDYMVRDRNWIEWDDAFWLPEVQKFIDEIAESIKDVDPFEATGVDHPGWYYYDEKAFAQGPFPSPEACYNHACGQ